MAVVGNHVSILVSSVISSNAKKNAYFISVYFANTTLFCNSAISQITYFSLTHINCICHFIAIRPRVTLDSNKCAMLVYWLLKYMKHVKFTKHNIFKHLCSLNAFE